MKVALYLAAFLTIAISIAHSWLGERYILRRLFRRQDLPAILGSSEFTVRTLRFAWHITSVAWSGFAAILVLLAHPPMSGRDVGAVIAATFVLHGAGALVGSRGRHLSWVVFLAIAALVVYATQLESVASR